MHTRVDEATTSSSGCIQTRHRLDCGGVAVELSCDHPAVAEFVVEYFDPWFRATEKPAEWSVVVLSSEPDYTAMRRRQPANTRSRPCFAHDQQVLSLPAWESDDVVNVADADRSCFLRLSPGRIELFADRHTRRWRFTLLWILQEIAATRLRRTCVDLHAASVEHAGRALLIAGPKNAGKTTLACHLMRAHSWRPIANDRSFVRAGTPPEVVGMPTAVKIRDSMLERFPELRSGLPPVARPYLYSDAELATAAPDPESPEAVDLALTPNQLAGRLGTATSPGAPLAAIVLPQVRDDAGAWAIESLERDELLAALSANFYGAATGERPATLFEQLGGDQPKPSRRRLEAAVAAVPGYRLRMARDAYADGSLGERLLRTVRS